MDEHRLEVHALLWRGITIEVTYEAHWLRREGFYCPCHLALKTIQPERYPLRDRNGLPFALYRPRMR